MISKYLFSSLGIFSFFFSFRGLRCSWEGLALLDSVLPALLVELETKVLQKCERHLRADEHDSGAANL